MNKAAIGVASAILGAIVAFPLGMCVAYREAVENDAAVWVYPSEASPDSPSRNDWLPSIMWRPASRLKR